MIENTQVVIRAMHLDDIENCMLLSNAEGWNQTEKDWKRLVDNSQNPCLVAESDHKIIGTATAINYANEVAWIGMVLVNKAYRGRGISKILLSDLLNQLKSCRSVKLDATPAGQLVYEKLGFKDEYIIYRMTAPSVESFQPDEYGITPESVLLSDIPEVAALDSSIFGAERSYLVKSLIKDNPDKNWFIKRNGRITAFALGRQGKKYQQIGPVFADNLKDAKDIISNALVKVNKESVVVDVLADKLELVQWLTAIGFTKQRHFVRMYLQQNPYPGIIKNQYLICGPEFG